jgi:hypothetical protein
MRLYFSSVFTFRAEVRPETVSKLNAPVASRVALTVGTIF